MCECVCVCVRARARVYVVACVHECILAVYNKAEAQRLSNREFKLWTIIQVTESREAETSVMSHQSLRLQSNTKANHLQTWSLGVRS